MEDLTELQQLVDSTVLEWPEVRAKAAFGHRGYVRNGKMFGFLADGGLAVKLFAGDESTQIYARDDVHAFAHSGMEMRAWPILPLKDPADVSLALEALQHACDRATTT